jgi:dihydroorotate dehydrogenase
LSGAPLKQYSLAALRTLRTNLPARIPLIGCGGIFTGTDALDYAKAGASLVQVYTAFGYDGAGACRRIKDQLVDELAKEGVTWGDVVKNAVTNLSPKGTSQARQIERELSETAAPSLQQLITEAEELKVLLDQLGEREL